MSSVVHMFYLNKNHHLSDLVLLRLQQYFHFYLIATYFRLQFYWGLHVMDILYCFVFLRCVVTGRHMGYGMRGHGMSFGSYAMTVNKTTVYPDFEDLDPTIEKLNTRLKENPIPGRGP